jgi:hypothetical protein
VSEDAPDGFQTTKCVFCTCTFCVGTACALCAELFRGRPSQAAARRATREFFSRPLPGAPPENFRSAMSDRLAHARSESTCFQQERAVFLWHTHMQRAAHGYSPVRVDFCRIQQCACHLLFYLCCISLHMFSLHHLHPNFSSSQTSRRHQSSLGRLAKRTPVLTGVSNFPATLLVPALNGLGQ